jgi:hypothetical protein
VGGEKAHTGNPSLTAEKIITCSENALAYSWAKETKWEREHGQAAGRAHHCIISKVQMLVP